MTTLYPARDAGLYWKQGTISEKTKMPGKMYSLWNLYARTELPSDATTEETELAHHAFNMGIYAYAKVLNDRIEHGDPKGALKEIQTLARTIALAQEQSRSQVQ